MNTSLTLLGVGALAVSLTTGCATKKFVRTSVDERATELDKKHTEAVGSLEQKMNQSVSRVEERAMTAENRANDAGRAAQQAQQTADQATTMAKSATDVSNQNQNRVQELQTAFSNIDNFRMASEEDVLFKFNSATLTTEGKEKLDQVAQQATGMGRFVVEVQGFTDRSGPAEYNLALSRRRADAVVRYLVDKQIPLRRIHMIGLGEATPSMAQMTGQQGTAQNTATSDEGRRVRPAELRRVVVRVWAPENAMSASAATGQTGASNPATSGTQTQPSEPSAPSTPSTPR
ncbi:MAG TPA: OmpA family protein [Bryobacteraceae bacterium]|nr:OmpA family protein [Bryobacteraceae bacterium]